jgi:hypothetical protein
MLWAQSLLIGEVLDSHAPMKTKKIRPYQPPFMNGALRKSIMKKTRLRNRFLKFGKPADWELFRVQRNKTTQLRRSSIKQYFKERCEGGPKNEHFYNTIKPFLSAKHRRNTNLMIQDDHNVLTDPKEVADKMNSFYTEIAAKIGEDKNVPIPSDFLSTSDFIDAALSYHDSHPSVAQITNNKPPNTEFAFHHTDVENYKKSKSQKGNRC